MENTWSFMKNKKTVKTECSWRCGRRDEKREVSADSGPETRIWKKDGR